MKKNNVSISVRFLCHDYNYYSQYLNTFRHWNNFQKNTQNISAFMDSTKLNLSQFFSIHENIFPAISNASSNVQHNSNAVSVVWVVVKRLLSI